MDVNARNRPFSTGDLDREDLWPEITELEEQACSFRFSFDLEQLPAEAGVILIRGPRQYGKSTWLELKLRETFEELGRRSAYFVNGDDIADEGELEAHPRDQGNYHRAVPAGRRAPSSLSGASGKSRRLQRLRSFLRDAWASAREQRRALPRAGFRETSSWETKRSRITIFRQIFRDSPVVRLLISSTAPISPASRKNSCRPSGD